MMKLRSKLLAAIGTFALAIGIANAQINLPGNPPISLGGSSGAGGGGVPPTLSAYSILGNNTASSRPGMSLQTLTLGTPGFVLSGDVALGQITGAGNVAAEFDIQNTNAGATASTDFIVNNDQATNTTHFGDFGINSSGFTGTGSLNIAGATYLYGMNGDLTLGTASANGIHFVINSGTTDAGAISSTGHTTFTDLALGGAALSGNALAVTGTANISSSLVVGGNLTLANAASLNLRNGGTPLFSNASGTFNFGNDSAAPQAQTFTVANVVAGTTDGAGANTIINLSRGTGTGVGGNLTINGAPHSTTGSTQNALSAALTINGDTLAATFGGSITVVNVTANAYTSTTASGTAFNAASGADYIWAGRGILSSPASGAIQLGSTDVDTAPVAQTLRAQGPLVGGTSNVAGPNWTFIAPLGKGNANSGDMIFQTGGSVGASGTTIATATTAMTIKGVTQAANFTGTLTTTGDNNRFVVANTATTGVAYLTTTSGWIGSGSVTDAALAANGNLKLYATGSNTATLSLTSTAVTDSGTLTVSTIGTGTGDFVCAPIGGGLISQGVTTCVASDKRVKNDLGVISPIMAIDRIMALPDEHRFTYKTGYGPSGDHTGWWAQDIAKIWPGIVYKGKPTKLTPDGELSLDRGEMGPDTTTAVKWLITQIRQQQAEIKSLDIENHKLSLRLDKLEHHRHG